MKYTTIYYWNMYAPHNILRKYIAHQIYTWADKKYGVQARGTVRGFRTYEHKGIKVSVSAFTPEQDAMLKKWHFWMKVKNKIA